MIAWTYDDNHSSEISRWFCNSHVIFENILGGGILWAHEHDNYAVSFGFMTTIKTNGTPMSLCVMGKLSLISDGEQKSIIDGYMYKCYIQLTMTMFLLNPG